MVLVAILLVPAANACTLRGDHPEGPGLFDIRELTGEAVGRVEVSERLLGSDCSLGNPYWLSPDEFAWAEGGNIHLRNATGSHQFAFNYVVRHITGDESGLVLRTDDDVRYVPRPLLAAASVALEIPSGWRLLELDGVHGQLVGESGAVRSYNLLDGEWDGPTVSETYRGLYSRDWMTVETASGRIRVVSTTTGNDAPVNVVGFPVALDGHRLWSRVGVNDTILYVDLVTGETGSVKTPFTYYQGPIVDGHIVQRYYSVSEFVEPSRDSSSGTTSSSSSTPSSQRESPGLGATLLLGALAVAFVRRNHRDRGP